MSHEFGAMPLPVPAPAAGEALSDPGLDDIADYFATTLAHYLAAAWEAVASANEPFVRQVYKYRPDESFLANTTPALYCFRDREDTAERAGDGFEQTNGKIVLIWVYPPTKQLSQIDRSAIFNGFSKALKRVAYRERDPSWVHAADVGDDAAEAYGSSIFNHGGIDFWQPMGCREESITIETETDKMIFPAIIGEVGIREVEATDLTVLPTGAWPTAIEFTINEDEVPAQHEIEPDP